MNRRHVVPRNHRLLPTLGLVLVLAGCGGGVSGTYTGTEGLIESMSFEGGTVEITSMLGIETGTFEVDGDRVHVTIAGETQTLAIDENGCLDGGMMIGVLCKD